MALIRVYENNKELDFSKQPQTFFSLANDKQWLYKLPLKNKSWNPYRLRNSKVRFPLKEVIDIK